MRFSSMLFAATLSVSPIALAAEAHALDSAKFVQQLETLLESDGTDVTYGRIETNNNILTINNFAIDDHKTGTGSEFNQLIFTNFQETSEGKFSYGGVTGDKFVRKGKNGSTLTIENIVSSGLQFSGSQDGSAIPDKVASVEATNISLSSQSRPESGSVTIPSISANGIERTSIRNFKMSRAAIAPFNARVFNSAGEPFDMNFDGASIADFEYFGLFGLDIGQIEFGGIAINTIGNEGPVNIAFQGALLENYYAWDPSEESRNIIPDADFKFEFQPLNISIAGKTAFSWEGGSGIAINDAEKLTSETKVEFNRFTFDTSAIKENPQNAKALNTLKGLGYEKLSMSMSAAGRVDLKSGVLNINKFLMDFADVGSLNMALEVSGYTEQVAQSIAKAASDLNTNSNPQAQQALGLQMLALFAPLSIQSLKLDVTDASLLNKVLTLQAQQSNRAPEELAAIVPPLAGIALAPLQVPDLASAITNALSTFMQGNKTISASIEPEGGVALTEILALGSGAQAGSIPPAEVVKRLNLQVIAK